MASVRLGFDGGRGRLAGKLELPDGPVRGYAVLAHCFTCGKDFKATKHLARALAEQGWATLRFDMGGLGESEGEFADTGFATNVADILAAAAALRRDYAAPGLLVGHSLGGTAALAAAPELPEVRAVAVIAAPAEPGHIVHQFERDLPRLAAAGEAEVLLAGRPFRLRQGFVDEVRAASIDAALAGLHKALLVLHSPSDGTVGVENARAIYDKARHPKSFVALEGVDHLLTRRADAEYAAGVIAAWARRYAGDGPVRAADADPLPAGEVTVESTGAGRFHQAVRAGRHRLVADEPVAAGGEDAGPGPYDYLLGALGACTSMTVRLYAARKGWPLEAVRVRLRHRRVHAADGAACERGGDARVDGIEREVALAGPLDAAQRARLLEIAERCPVHRTLEAGLRISTAEAPPGAPAAVPAAPGGV